MKFSVSREWFFLLLRAFCFFRVDVKLWWVLGFFIPGYLMDLPSKPSCFMFGCVGTLWNDYLTVLSSQLDRVASVVASIFLTSRNYKDGAQANMQYILNLRAPALGLLSA